MPLSGSDKNPTASWPNGPNLTLPYLEKLIHQAVGFLLLSLHPCPGAVRVAKSQQPLRLNDPNPYPETEIRLYKSCLCLGVTKIQKPLRPDEILPLSRKASLPKWTEPNLTLHVYPF